MTTSVRRLVLLTTMAVPSPAGAQTPPPNLGQMSIEDLMNVEVTTAARREQRVGDAPAAVYIITSDVIRRSGMTTVPDLLRLVPGVDVAQINSNKWAVSVRGFNGWRANKLLVLVDGRSIYNRIFAGVFWENGDVVLEDVDRIEVIRGPGAALWGANAVNGVVNIVTKAAADTQGGLARVDLGRSGTQAGVRYGGTLGAAHYRLFSQWTGRSESLLAPGTRADDGSRSVTSGGRADWARRSGAATIGGAFTVGRDHALWPNLDARSAARDPIARDASDSIGGHVFGRWTHTHAGGGVQPTARVMWKGLPRQRIWAAASRALRTPSLEDRGIRVAFPPVPSAGGIPVVLHALGNPAARTETLIAAEAGYRVEIRSVASIDLTGFVGRYDHLRTYERAAPVLELLPSPRLLIRSQFGNLLDATTRGFEAAGRWNPLPAWRLDASYTAFGVSPRLDAASHDAASAFDVASAPRTQWQVRSSLTLSPRARLDLALFHVGRLEQLRVASYTRADINGEWRFSDRLTAMATAQNLFDAAHFEFGQSVSQLLLPTQMPRSINVRLRWTFR